ncbi:MAG: tRNA (guanine(46)-N(7))-methyltransferase TrmB [Rhizobiaceae bacterium]|nr:tRNA (guanine(46)-N(7))-methyltransferase TrmB [Rhizobiaceae bacterium]
MASDSGPSPKGAFFGRRRGRPLRQSQEAAFEAARDSYALDLTRPAPTNLSDLFQAPVRDVRLEIGFGGGEHLLFRARENPTVGFIGVEPFINGMAKVTASLAGHPLDNVRLYGEDAIHVLDWLPLSSLAGVDLFYPDPWPKKKHWKRRFVSQPNLDRIWRVLKPGGLFRFASDIDHYVNWTLLECRKHGGFEWLAQDANDWRKPYDGWPGTRYEAKALREGRTPAYLSFARSAAKGALRG